MDEKEQQQLIEFLKETEGLMYKGLDHLEYSDSDLYLKTTLHMGKLRNVVRYMEDPKAYEALGYKKPW